MTIFSLSNVLQLVVSAVGVLFNGIMLRLAWQDLQAVKESGKNGPRLVVAGAHVRDEAVRVAMQIVLLVAGYLLAVYPTTDFLTEFGVMAFTVMLCAVGVMRYVERYTVMWMLDLHLRD